MKKILSIFILSVILLSNAGNAYANTLGGNEIVEPMISIPTMIYHEEYYLTNIGVNIIRRTINRNGYFYSGELYCTKGLCKGMLTLIPDPY